MYVHGGIYVDIDTECRAPVQEWIGDEHRLVATVENQTGAVGNFAFAAAPRHPALMNVLRTFMDLYHSDSFLCKISPTPVQDFGAGGWSMGILSHYNLYTAEAMKLGGYYYSNSKETLVDNAIFYSAESRVISPYATAQTKVFHQTASVFWTGEYNQWREEERRLMQG